MAKKYQPKSKYELTTHIAVVLLLLILFLSVSYFLFLAKPDEQARLLELESRLQSSRTLWQTRRPERFRYVVDRNCDCSAEDEMRFIVSVFDGQRAAEYPIPVESSTGIMITVPPNPLWIDDIFELVARAIEAGVKVDVRYHGRYGFPEYVELTQEGMNAPTEQYEIRDFEIIQ
jgi:hypothetical protein